MVLLPDYEECGRRVMDSPRTKPRAQRERWINIVGLLAASYVGGQRGRTCSWVDMIRSTVCRGDGGRWR
jgi:hypothetical protein